jgi:hypothetical protein
MKREQIYKLIPIFLIFFLFIKTKEFVFYSNTILGKLFAMIIILFYAKQDIMLGVLVCFIIAIYYQTIFLYSSDIVSPVI